MTKPENMDRLRAILAQYRDYLEHDPNNLRLIYEIVDLQSRIGEFDAVRSEIDRALQLYPHEPGLRFRAATLDIACGNLANAVSILLMLLREGVGHSAVLYNLGYAQMLQGNYETARTTLEKISPIDDPGAPKTAVLLARCLHHLDDLESGIEIICGYIQQYPDDSEALGVLALLRWDEGLSDEAVIMAHRALDQDPENVEATIVKGSAALEAQNTEEASADFERVLKKYPTNGRAWSGLGLTQMLEQNIPIAVESFKKATVHLSNHIGTWHALAWCQISTREIEKAKSNFEHALQLNRNFSESHGGLAVIAVIEGDFNDAQVLIKRALRLDPNSFAGRFAHSLLANHTNPQIASAMIGEILASKIDPRSRETLSVALQRGMRNRSV